MMQNARQLPLTADDFMNMDPSIWKDAENDRMPQRNAPVRKSMPVKEMINQIEENLKKCSKNTIIK